MPYFNRVYNRIYLKPWGYKRSVLIDNIRSIEAIEIIMKKGDETKLHYHNNVLEMFYIVSGEMRFYINDKEYKALEGDLIVVEPGEKHKIVADEDSRIFIIKTPANEEDRIFLE